MSSSQDSGQAKDIAEKVEDAVKVAAIVTDVSNTDQIKIFETIEKLLPGDVDLGVDFRQDGAILIEVPDDYSRSNLQALGINDPSALIRSGSSEPGRAIIEVPADMIPPELQWQNPDLKAVNPEGSIKTDAKDIEVPDVKGGFWHTLAKRSGLIGGVVIGGVVGTAAFVGGASTAEAAEITFEAAVPYGETALDIAEGDMEAAAKSATIETAATVGGIAAAIPSAAAGATAGAAIGSIVPILGTAVGGVVGGVIGGIAGGIGGGILTGSATDYAYEKAGKLWGGIKGLFNDAANVDEMQIAITQQHDVSDFSNDQSAYSGDVSLIEEAVRAGVKVNPSLLPQHTGVRGEVQLNIQGATPG